MPETKNDIELVKASLEDRQAFLHIMERYEGKLLAYIRRISGLNKEDAEDVLQEVFLKTYTNLNAFNQKLKFSSWIYRIARNETISEARKRKARPVYYFEDKDLVRIADGLEVDVDLIKSEDAEDVRNVIESLDKKYREVLVLKFLEEKDYNEISDILKKPVGTVGTLINRAKKKFKEKFLTSSRA